MEHVITLKQRKFLGNYTLDAEIISIINDKRILTVIPLKTQSTRFTDEEKQSIYSEWDGMLALENDLIERNS